MQQILEDVHALCIISLRLLTQVEQQLEQQDDTPVIKVCDPETPTVVDFVQSMGVPLPVVVVDSVGVVDPVSDVGKVDLRTEPPIAQGKYKGMSAKWVVENDLEHAITLLNNVRCSKKLKAFLTPLIEQELARLSIEDPNNVNLTNLSTLLS